MDTTEAAGEKKCPFCAESIKTEAIKCRHCGERLDRAQTNDPRASLARKGLYPDGTWSPGIAVLLSLLLPGAGQAYKGQWATGILYLIFTAAGYGLFFYPGIFVHILCVYNAARGKVKS